jgi:hypothetical protein
VAQPQPVPQPQPAPHSEPALHRRRRRRSLWPLALGFVLILVVLVAIGDRVAAAAAEAEVRDRVADELATRNVSYSSLDVSVDGMPFLTQVAQGRYESITIDLTEVHLVAGGREATLPTLRLVANGLRVDSVALAQGDATGTADAVTGTAVVSYPTLTGLLDLEGYYLAGLTLEERAGALWASADLSAAGIALPIEAAAEVAVHEGRIELRLRDAAAVGVSVPDLALPLLNALANAVLIATMPPLPFGIELDGLTVTPAGLAITATGREVTLIG